MLISDIVIQNRIRVDFGEIKELAESIKDRGLFYPIIIERGSNILLDGERRLRACRDILKWKDIPVLFLDSLSPLEQRLVEIESNLKRKAFTWQEEAKATLELHNLLQQKEGIATVGRGQEGWGVRQTAELLKISPATVTINCQLAEALDNLRYKTSLDRETKKINAYKKLKLMQESDTLTQLKGKISVKESKSIQIDNVDCLVGMRQLPDAYIDLIITDPPYGINLDKGALTTNFDLYKDNKEDIINLLKNASKEFHRILKPQGIGLMFFHIAHYSEIMNLLVDAGLAVWKIPFIWIKNTSMSTACMMHFYESAFVFSSGDKFVVPNTLKDFGIFKAVPFTEKKHPVQKPLSLALHLVEALSLPGNIILDPFCGVGTFVLAGALLGRKSIGFEIDSQYYTNAKIYCNKILNQKQKQLDLKVKPKAKKGDIKNGKDCQS